MERSTRSLVNSEVVSDSNRRVCNHVGSTIIVSILTEEQTDFAPSSRLITDYLSILTELLNSIILIKGSALDITDYERSHLFELPAERERCASIFWGNGKKCCVLFLGLRSIYFLLALRLVEELILIACL